MRDSLTVVIATTGRPDLLRRTLTSLAACRRPERLDGVIVIENGPRCGAEQVVADCADSAPVTYRSLDNAGASAALNLAVAEIEDGLIFFTDDDVRFSKALLDAYAGAARREPRAYFGGPVSVDRANEPPPWLARFLPFSAKGWSLPDPTPQRGAHAFMGANWAAFAADLRRAGPFDETLGPGSLFEGMETEMQQRLRSCGLDGVYLPEARVWHYVPPERCTAEWMIDRARRQTAGAARMICRSARPLMRRARDLACMTASAARTAALDKSPLGFRLRYGLGCVRGVLDGAMGSRAGT